MEIHIDLNAVRLRVELEIENYAYSIPKGSIGLAWTDERVSSEIQQFKSVIVSPYWANVKLRDTFEQVTTKEPITQACVVVADDLRSGVMVLFDPVQDEFVLGQRTEDAVITIGVRGDAVGCFMAR